MQSIKKKGRGWLLTKSLIFMCVRVGVSLQKHNFLLQSDEGKILNNETETVYINVAMLWPLLLHWTPPSSSKIQNIVRIHFFQWLCYKETDSDHQNIHLHVLKYLVSAIQFPANIVIIFRFLNYILCPFCCHLDQVLDWNESNLK